jgi:hypothetical protein
MSVQETASSPPAVESSSATLATVSGTTNASAEPAAERIRREKASVRRKLTIVGAVAALAGIVFGGVVEYFVGNLLDSTGWFGPTIETVIEEQLTNFSAIQQKLADLEKATTDAERTQLTRELNALMAQQEKLAARTHTELREHQKELDSLRQQSLLTSGVSGGVDFWLEVGESVNVGSRENVFALTRIYSQTAYVTINGQAKSLRPGDFVEVTAGGGTYRVFYRNAPRADDRSRVGFDVVKINS